MSATNLLVLPDPSEGVYLTTVTARDVSEGAWKLAGIISECLELQLQRMSLASSSLAISRLCCRNAYRASPTQLGQP